MDKESKRWSDEETRKLLDYMELHKNIEPTARIYYSKLIDETGISCAWHTLKYKVRYLRLSLRKANTLGSLTGSMQNDEAIKKQICPYYKQLMNIFGLGKDPVDPADIEQPIDYAGSRVEYTDCDAALSQSDVGSFILEPSGSEFEVNQFKKAPSQVNKKKRKKSDTPMDKIVRLETERMEFREKQHRLEADRLKWLKQMEGSKLQLEKEKFEWAKQIEEHRLSFENRKLKMDERKMDNDFLLRKMELELKYKCK
ncbi:uncharacterized protein LOC135428620 isoform X2 [Drosophila montana]|uniref:uncharacterized protein LOC135428620 isoform X2 n=1 Tax=Drosophila montana TaxID=40370 RepID=UPI00313B7AD2